MGCPDVWSNIILGVSLSVFLDEINIRMSRLSKADYLPQCGWASSNQLKAWIEEKGWGRRNSFCLTAFQLGHCCCFFFLCLWTQSETLALGACQLLDLNYMISPPESSACKLQLSGLFSLQHWVSQFFIKNLFLYTFHWFCFSGEPWLIQYSYRHSPILALSAFGAWHTESTAAIYWYCHQFSWALLSVPSLSGIIITSELEK